MFRTDKFRYYVLAKIADRVLILVCAVLGSVLGGDLRPPMEAMISVRWFDNPHKT